MVDTNKEIIAPEAEETPVMPEQTDSPIVNEQPNDSGELVEILSRFMPEADVSTPEAQLSASLQLLKSFVPLHDKLYDLAETNPESAAALSDWLETGNLIKAIARNFGEEEKQALIEELEDESYEEDRGIYAEKNQKLKDRQSQLEKNKASSQMGAQEFVDEVGATEEQIQEFIPFVDKFITDCEDRNMSKENWLTLWKGFKRDSDVSEAETNGRIMGRNEKIVAEKKSRQDIAGVLPEINGTAAVKPQSQKPKAFGGKFIEGVL